MKKASEETIEYIEESIPHALTQTILAVTAGFFAGRAVRMAYPLALEAFQNLKNAAPETVES